MFYLNVLAKRLNVLIVVIAFMKLGAQSLPINNGFTIKLNPVSLKEDRSLIGAMFAKISQEVPSKVSRELLTEDVLPRSVDLATGCTNQIARILFPTQDLNGELNCSTVRNKCEFINVPVLTQNVRDYKILVVSAPHKIKLGKGGIQPLLVYIVFPTDDSNDSLNIPNVYFVNKSDGKLDLKSREKVEPIMIIDNNRIVTGLKSKEVSKFVKFKSKYTTELN